MSISFILKSNFVEPVSEKIDWYFNLSEDAPLLETIAKVISYVTGIIPLIAFAMKKCIDLVEWLMEKSIEPLEPQILGRIIVKAPLFQNYRLGKYPLSAVSIKPINLFLEKIAQDHSTLPKIENPEPFCISMNPNEIKKFILEQEPFTLTIEAGKEKCGIAGFSDEVPLETIYGKDAFTINQEELKRLFESQTIHTAPMLPIHFYKSLKAALEKDGITTYSDSQIKEFKTLACKKLIENVQLSWRIFGFPSEDACKKLLELTIDQLSPLIVRAEDYYLFTNPDGTIRNRKAKEEDAIHMINACGMANFRINEKTAFDIMIETFQTILVAAEKDYVIFPALAMNMRTADPDFYWNAFFTAVSNTNTSLDYIFVNPRHKSTLTGIYAGKKGEEFKPLLDDYLRKYPDNPNLKKIIYLDMNPAILPLSLQLKQALPEKKISLVNDCYPHNTFTDQIGGNINCIDHPFSSEEAYTALGTKGLTSIKGIYEDPDQIVQTSLFQE